MKIDHTRNGLPTQYDEEPKILYPKKIFNQLVLFLIMMAKKKNASSSSMMPFGLNLKLVRLENLEKGQQTFFYIYIFLKAIH